MVAVPIEPPATPVLRPAHDNSPVHVTTGESNVIEPACLVIVDADTDTVDAEVEWVVVVVVTLLDAFNIRSLHLICMVLTASR